MTPADPTTFAAFAQQHVRLIHKVARAYGRNAADREDLAQEIALQLWRSWPRYDAGRRASTWVYRIALNVAISFHRRARRHTQEKRAPEEALITLASTGEPEPDEELEILHRCIAELDELNRALVLLYLDGNDHASIAEVLGISVTNVGTKLGRIKQTLKSAFERHSADT